MSTTKGLTRGLPSGTSLPRGYGIPQFGSMSPEQQELALQKKANAFAAHRARFEEKRRAENEKIAGEKLEGQTIRTGTQYITIVGGIEKSHLGAGISDFEREVNEHLRMGWRPVGGVSLDGGQAAQALEKSIIPSYDLLGEEEALLGMPARSAGLEEVFSSNASSRGGSNRRKRSVRKNKTRKQK